MKENVSSKAIISHITRQIFAISGHIPPLFCSPHSALSCWSFFSSLSCLFCSGVCVRVSWEVGTSHCCWCAGGSFISEQTHCHQARWNWRRLLHDIRGNTGTLLHSMSVLMFGFQSTDSIESTFQWLAVQAQSLGRWLVQLAEYLFKAAIQYWSELQRPPSLEEASVCSGWEWRLYCWKDTSSFHKAVHISQSNFRISNVLPDVNPQVLVISID